MTASDEDPVEDDAGEDDSSAPPLPEPDPKRAEDLLLDALDQPPDQREAYIRAAAETPAIAEAALRMLVAHGNAGSFLEPATDLVDARTLHHGDADDAPPDLRGQYIGERYELLEELARGGFGVVYEAHDFVAQRNVAVKILSRGSAEHARATANELPALLLLDIPGVVRLLDHGVHLGQAYFVTELIRGAPFPGCAPPVEWSGIQATALSLLDTLRRMHAAGIVHGDIKPANVLVDAHGQPTLLDLGVASGPALVPNGAENPIGGTLAFFSPERLVEPIPAATPASDMFAVGGLLYQALTGKVPHVAEHGAAFHDARRTTTAPLELLTSASVPLRAVAAIEQLLSMDPADRPSAAGALQQLSSTDGVLREPGLPLPPGTLFGPDQLRALFAGPDRLFHLAEDAAQLLFELSGGSAERVRLELAEWIRTGAATQVDDLIHIDHRGIERVRRIRAGDVHVAPEIAHLADAADLQDFVDATVALSGDLLDTGHVVRAESMLFAALAVARARSAPAAQLDRLLARLVSVSLSPGGERGLELALYECERSAGSRSERPVVWRLADAALRAARGDRHAALALAEAIGTCEDFGLEASRRSILTYAARPLGIDISRRVVDDAVSWAGNHPAGRLMALEWQGWQLYLEGQFAEAAALHRQVAELATTPMKRASALLNASSAYLEAYDLENARAAAATVAELARSGRHGSFEARAERVLRAASYRLCAPITVDHELVGALPLLRTPSLEALILLGEAAIGWRADDREVARELASRAAARWGNAARGVPGMLALALARGCGAELPAGALEPALDPAGKLHPPGGHLQILALHAYVEGELSPELQALAASLAAELPARTHGLRREVLSVDEALAYCGL